MKSEIIIKDWLMAWLRPEKVTSYNANARQPLIDNNNSFGKFIEIFKDETGDNQFTDEEKDVLKRIILNPLKFGTGYPINEKEAIQLGSVYIIGGGWQQSSKFVGSNFWEGRSTTHIAVVGMTTGDTLNMAEPSLLLNVITSLLIAGYNHFTAHHLLNPVITETLYAQDETNSMQKGFSIRTLSIAYDSKRHGVITV